MKTRSYLIFIDVLGFENFAENLSHITKLEPAFIRESFITKPLSQKISDLCSDEDKHYAFTDNHFVVVDSLDKVFKIIKKTSSISVPLLDPICIPVEIAVGKKFISKDFDPINQNEIVRFLKNDILTNYREYYKSKNDGRPIHESYVVITKDLYDDLPSGRNQLCTEVNYQNKNYFFTDLGMMRDIDGTATRDIIELKKFTDKLSKGSIWNYFEVKTLIYKDEDDEWKLEFAYIKLLEDSLPEKEEIQTRHCRISHRVNNIRHFNDVLDSFTRKEFAIDGIIPSLINLDNFSKYSFSGIVNNMRISYPASDYGFKEPSYSLIKGGNSSSLRNVERVICEELQNYDPPVVSNTPLIDAVKSFGLEFWKYGYMPFMAVFAPITLQFPMVLLNNDSIEIRIICSDLINPEFLNVTIGGRRGSDPALPQLSLNNLSRQGSAISLVQRFDKPYPEIDGVMLKIFYLGDLLDDCYIPMGERVG